MKTAIRIWGSLVRNRIPIAVVAAFIAVAWSATGTSCVLQATTGIPCPGCGLARSAILAMQGDFDGAFRMHPLFLLGTFVLLVLPFVLWQSPKLLESRTFRIAGVTIVILFLVVYAGRMIIGFPHAAPMMYNYDSFLGRIVRMSHWIV
jgi:hypothetical protein